MDGANKVAADPVAVHGHIKVDPNHEMVSLVLEEGSLVSVRDIIDRQAAMEDSPLAVVPLIDVNERIHGVLIIEDMLFLSLQEENLRLLAVLGGQIGDMLALASSRSGTDADSARFIRETQRAILNRRQFGLPAMLVNIQLPTGEQSKEVETLLLRQRRGLDCIWVRGDASGKTLLLLMPLTGPIEYEGYQKRIAQILRERFGQSIEELGLRITTREIMPKEKIDTLLSPND